MALDEAQEKAFVGLAILVALHENVNDIAILINRPIQIVALSLKGDKDFIDMPRIAKKTLALFEFTRIVRPKLLAPLPNGLIRDGDAPFG